MDRKDYEQIAHQRKMAISWWLRTKCPDQQFDLVMDGAKRRVTKPKEFWAHVGELFRQPVRITHWEDGTFAELHELLKANENNFYSRVKGQENSTEPPQEIRERDAKSDEGMDF